MNGIPCNIHGIPALFLGIVFDDDSVRAVYTSLDKPCLYLSMTHPSHVQFAPVDTSHTQQATTAEKIRLIKLLREAVDVALDDDRRTVEGDKLYLSLSTAKKLAEKFIEGRV